MAKTPTPEEMERKYREDNDARTLADADAIRANPDRMKGAKVGAKRMAKDATQAAAEQKARAEGLKKLAGSEKSKPAKKEPSKPASKPKPAAKKAAAAGKKGGKR